MDPGFQLTPAENILCSEIGVFGCLSVCCLISYKPTSPAPVAAVSTYYYDPAAG